MINPIQHTQAKYIGNGCYKPTLTNITHFSASEFLYSDFSSDSRFSRSYSC